MSGLVRKQVFLAIVMAPAMLMLAVSAAPAAQVVSTTARGLPSVSNIAGFGIVPAGTQPAAYGDLAPIQLFEITKPANQSVTIGRMFTSCTCVVLESDQRTFGPGERAVLRMRNVQATPPGGQSYALYVQISSPVNTTLRYDTYVQSAQFVPAPDGAPPTRGNIVADGVYSPTVDPGIGGASIDVIVPKAENYQPDTSEYTLRKRAAEAAEAVEKKLTADLGNAAATPKKNERPAPERAAVAVAAAPAATQAAAQVAAAEKPPRPAMPPQIRTAIDAAISQAERDLRRADRESEGAPSGTVSERARAEAQVAANLSTNQSGKYQTEARQIGQDILNHATRPIQRPEARTGAASSGSTARDADTFAGRAMSRGDDDLWRTPAPRGTVRSNLPRIGRDAAKTTTDTAKAAERVIANTIGQPNQTSGQTIVNTIKSNDNAVIAAPFRDGGRTITESVQSAETAIAERARLAAQEVGRGVQSARSAAAAVGASPLQQGAGAFQTTAQGAVDAARSTLSGATTGAMTNPGAAASDFLRGANRP